MFALVYRWGRLAAYVMVAGRRRGCFVTQLLSLQEVFTRACRVLHIGAMAFAKHRVEPLSILLAQFVELYAKGDLIGTLRCDAVNYPGATNFTAPARNGMRMMTLAPSL